MNKDKKLKKDIKNDNRTCKKEEIIDPRDTMDNLDTLDYESSGMDRYGSLQE